MRERFTLRQLEYFALVAREGSVVGGAREARVSPPTVSAAIAQLEAQLGLNLFVRHRAKGLTLTQAGRQMLTQAEALLIQARKFGRMAENVAQEVRGELALGCLLSFAQIIVPGLRRAFEAAYPDVEIRQFELDQQGIFERLKRADIDAALSYDMDIPSDLEFVPLVPLHPFVMLAEAHPLAGRAQVSADELVDHPMVLLDLPYSSDYFLSFFNGTGRAPDIRERTRDMAVMRSLVANGYGYGIANIRPLSRKAPDGKSLVFVPLVGAVEPMQLGIVKTREAGEAGVTLAAFVAHAREYLLQDNRVPGVDPVKQERT